MAGRGPFEFDSGGVGQAQVDASINAAIAMLIDGAPENLDTLNELAEALNDDADFATTVINMINTQGMPTGGSAGEVLTKVDGVDFNAVWAPAAVSYTDENAQDAVGGILLDSSTIDFTYNDSTPSITAIVIDNSIANAKIRQSAGLSVVGRAGGTTGNVADITATAAGQVLRHDGTDLGFGTLLATSFANGIIVAARMYSPTGTVLFGRYSSGAGNGQEVGVGGGLEFNGGASIQRSALTGDVVAAAGSNDTDIAAGAVTNSKIRDGVANSVIGRAGNSTGQVSDISAGVDGYVLRLSGTTLGFGTLIAASFADNTIVAARQSFTAQYRLVGRVASGAGAGAEIASSANVFTLLGSADFAAFRSNLSLVVGTNVQAWDADLDSLASASGTNTVYYRSAANTWSPVTFSSDFTFTGGVLDLNGSISNAMTIYEYVATAAQTVFSGADANGVTLAYVAGSIAVYQNGVLLRPGDDYTATNGTSITLTSAAALSDEIVIVAFSSFDVANTYTQAQVTAFLAAKFDIANLATNAEYIAATSTTKALTPANSKAMPYFYAELTSSQASIADATATKVAFSNALKNIGSYYNTTNRRWTPPAGKILLRAQAWITGTISAGALVYLIIYKNGGNVINSATIRAIVANDVRSEVTWIDEANGTDYYEIYVYIDTSSGTGTVNENSLVSYFEGLWLGGPS